MEVRLAFSVAYVSRSAVGGGSMVPVRWFGLLSVCWRSPSMMSCVAGYLVRDWVMIL